MTKENILYQGNVHLIFDDFRHQYRLNHGDIIPSVTQIISIISKDALVPWAAKVTTEYVESQIKPGIAYDEIQLSSIFKEARLAHRKKKEDSADIGSMVHDWIEKYIKKEEPEMPHSEILQSSINNFLKWVKEHDVKFLLSEQPVYSREHNYCGTLDFVARIKDQLFLGDIKTSNAIYDTYWVQLAAYGHARSEEFPSEKYKRQGIIRISRDGTFEFAVADHPEKNLKAFLAAKELYLGMQEIKSDKKG